MSNTDVTPTGGSFLSSRPNRASGWLLLVGLIGLLSVSLWLNLSRAEAAAIPGPVVIPASANFGPIKVGSSSAPQVFTISNPSTFMTETVTLSQGGSADFKFDTAGVKNPCPIGATALPPGTSCGFRITFRPASINSSITGQINVASTPDASNPPTIPLNGSGYADDVITPNPGSLGVTTPGGTVLNRTFTYTHNYSNTLYTFTVPDPVTTAAGTFAVDLNAGTCGAINSDFSLGGYGSTCTFGVSFTPSATAGDASANFTLTGYPSGVASFVATASSVAPVTVNPNALTFTHQVGAPPDANSVKLVVITNNDPKHSFALTATPPANYTVSNNCATVAPGACNLSVTFNPATAGAFNGTLGLALTANTPNGPYSQTFQVNLSGTATPAPTTVPPTTAPPSTTKPSQPSNNNVLSGQVILDGQPAAGFVVNLVGPITGTVTTAADGRYNFGRLPDGSYTIVLSYDPAKYSLNGSEKIYKHVQGGQNEGGLNYNLTTIATTPASPTPTSTTRPVFKPVLTVTPANGPPGATVQVNGTGWNPTGPNGGPNQVTLSLDKRGLTGSSALRGFSVAQEDSLGTVGQFPIAADGTFSGQVTLPSNLTPQAVFLIGTDLYQQQAQTNVTIQSGPSCPATPPSPNLRMATQVVQRDAKSFYVCIRVTAGNGSVNLRDTVIAAFPNGSTIDSAQASKGTVTTTGSTARWGGFDLASQESATLLVTVSTPNGTLEGTNVTISGRFGRGQAFQQSYNNLPPLVEIPEPQVSATGQGGVAQPTPDIPAAAPITGKSSALASADDNAADLWLWVGLLALWLLGLIALLSRRRRRL